MIPYGRHYINNDDIQAVTDVLRGDWLTQGPKVKEFESIVAEFVGARYAVAVSSGTAALHLAALVLDIGQDDIVVTSPNTFVATANAVCFAGGSPVFVDINSNTLNIDTQLLEQYVQDNQNIKAIFPVHFGGLPCDMAKIKSMADSCGAKIVEDAAHALGAMYEDGTKVGNCKYSDITIFSFHPVKLIAAGEGGMLTTNDKEIYQKLLRLRSHGINKEDDKYIYPENACDGKQKNPWYYEMQELGYNYRITDFQCALASSQFSKLDQFVSRNREIAAVYDRSFLDNAVIRAGQAGGYSGNSAYHIYVIQVSFEDIGINRGKVMELLKERGIGTQVHYIPVHLHPYYQSRGFKPGDFPVVENYYKQALTIPLYYSLSDQEQQSVIEKLNEIIS